MNIVLTVSSRSSAEAVGVSSKRPADRRVRRVAALLALMLAFGLIVALIPPPAHAQGREYFQWEDADGQVNFGDNPPKNARNLKKFNPAGRPSKKNLRDRDRINEEQNKLTEDLGKRDGAEETEDKIDTAKELLAKQKELDQARCQNLRNNLSSYNAGGRVFSTDPVTGEKVYLDDDAINARRAAAQKQIDSNCK